MENTVDHRGDGQTVGASDSSNSALEPSTKGIHTEEIGSKTASTAESQNIQSTPVESASLSNPVPRPASRTGSVSTVLPSTGSREALHSSAQEVIEEINAKRKQDTQILADFKKAMEMQVSKMCNLVEQQMFRTYEKEGKKIQTKLTELFATLDRIAQVETELQQFKQALQILYQEMQHGD